MDFPNKSPVLCHSLKHKPTDWVSGDLLLAPGLETPCKMAAYHQSYPERQGETIDGEAAGGKVSSVKMLILEICIKAPPVSCDVKRQT